MSDIILRRGKGGAALNLTLADYANNARLSLVANNCQLSSNLYTDTNPINNNRTKHKSGPTGYRGLKVAFVNGTLTTNGEVNGSHDYSITAGINLNGLYKQVTFSGATSASLVKEWGTTIGSCDIYIPPNTEFYITNYREATDSASSLITITGITNANPCVVTYSGVDPVNGDTRRFASVGGTTQLNYATNGNVAYKVASVDTVAKTFVLTTTLDVNVNSTAYGVYTSGGTASRVYNWHYSTVGTLAQGGGCISQAYASKADYTIGIGLPGGVLAASILPLTPANFSAGVLSTCTKDQVGSAALNGIGSTYTSGLTMAAYYGAAGVNQPGSQYAGATAPSGNSNNSGGIVSSISVSGGGTGHDPEAPPPLFLGGGGGFGSATQAVYGPQCIMGIPDDHAVPSILFIGDSITAAMMSVDSTGDIFGNFGVYEQAIANRAGVMKFAVNGESATGWLQNYTKQMTFLDVLVAAGLRISVAAVCLGTNDFNTYNYSDQDTRVASSMTLIIAILKTNSRVDKCITSTVIPEVTGTYTTLGGQTAITVTDGVNTPSTGNFGSGGRVITYNTGIRNGTNVPTQDGYVDLAIVIADSTNTYRFRVDGQFYLQYSTAVAFTTDGIHPNLGAGIPYAAMWLDVRCFGIKDTPLRVRTRNVRIARNGEVGQIIKSVVASGSAVSLTTATPKTVTSIQLPAGIWEVMGVTDFVLSAATTTNFTAGFSQVTDTLGTTQDSSMSSIILATLLSDSQSIAIPVQSITVPIGKVTTVYMIGQCTFSAGTVTAYGTLRARRVANIQ